jgi:hypothetical protein
VRVSVPDNVLYHRIIDLFWTYEFDAYGRNRDLKAGSLREDASTRERAVMGGLQMYKEMSVSASSRKVVPVRKSSPCRRPDYADPS